MSYSFRSRVLASISSEGDAVPYVLELAASEDGASVAAALSSGVVKVFSLVEGSSSTGGVP